MATSEPSRKKDVVVEIKEDQIEILKAVQAANPHQAKVIQERLNEFKKFPLVNCVKLLPKDGNFTKFVVDKTRQVSFSGTAEETEKSVIVRIHKFFFKP